jgi:hypothetical protein
MSFSAFYSTQYKYVLAKGHMKKKNKSIFKEFLTKEIHPCFYLFGICHCIVEFAMEKYDLRFVFTKNIEDK